MRTYLAGAGSDRTIKLWEVVKGKSPTNIKGHKSTVLTVCFSPNGHLLASGSADGQIKLWRWDGFASSYVLDKTLKGHRGAVFQVNFSLDGQQIVSCSADDTVKLWQANGKLTKTIKGEMGGIFGVSFMPEGKVMAIAGADGTIKLLYLDGICLNTLLGHQDWVYSVNFHPNGKKLLSGSRDGTVKLWTKNKVWGRKSEAKTLTGHENGAIDACFHPQEDLVASAGADGMVNISRLDGSLVHQLSAHHHLVYSVNFSPDGKFLATSSEDGTVKLWQVKKFRLMKSFHLPKSSVVYQIRFSPNI
jgi:WD40 repeat protein